MRDLERWKDKVELSLDGRQIFFLFFGGAVAACLLFVLGVLVGKRLEARALALTPPPVDDPLAALDQLGDTTSDDESLTFHKALTRDARREPIKIASAVPLIPVAARPEPAPETPKETPKAEPPKEAPKPAAAAAPAPAAKDASALHFTLQLSAFPERAGAEEFMRKIQAAGYKPFLVASEIPGKGVFYRVRVGDYSSRQAANDAKGEFERKQKMIAYVAKL
jgi:cell division septation protein DedD